MKVIVSFAVAVLGFSTAHAELAPAAAVNAGRVVTRQAAERNDAVAEHSARIAADLERKVEALIEARVAEHLAAAVAVEPELELVARAD